MLGSRLSWLLLLSLLLRRTLSLLLWLLLALRPRLSLTLLRTLLALAGLSRTLAALGTLAALPSRALFAAAALAGALLELADLRVHVPPGLALLSLAELVMAAVGAAFPPLGIGLLTRGTKDAFG